MIKSERDGCGLVSPAIAQSDFISRERSGCSSSLRPVLLTVIVPAYNEAATIDTLLRRVFTAPYQKQVIVVDDGSSDGTGVALREWEGHPSFLILRHPVNCGKGAAIRTGLAKALGRYTLIQDADLETDPGEYPRLLEPLLTGLADVVYGSRFLRRTGPDRLPWTRNRLGVVGLNLWLRLLYGARLTDEATCYKVFPTEILRRMDLSCERFEFCPEVTGKACRMGLRIHEVPVSYHPRSLKDGKKIRWRDGVTAAITLWKYRNWSPRVR